MFRALARHPEVDTLTWFNLDKGSDWRIEAQPRPFAHSKLALVQVALGSLPRGSSFLARWALPRAPGDEGATH